MGESWSSWEDPTASVSFAEAPMSFFLFELKWFCWCLCWWAPLRNLSILSFGLNYIAFTSSSWFSIIHFYILLKKKWEGIQCMAVCWSFPTTYSPILVWSLNRVKIRTNMYEMICWLCIPYPGIRFISFCFVGMPHACILHSENLAIMIQVQLKFDLYFWLKLQKVCL